MAAASSTELLGEVLKDLNELLAITKKSQIDSEKSNVPESTIGKVLQSNGGINNIAASLNTITSIRLLKSVKKEDVEYVADLMKTLSTSIKGLSMTKDDAESFNRLISSFATITKVFSDLSGNLFGSFKKFSPAQGRIIGWRLGRFYKALLKGFESEKLGDVLKGFKDSEHLGNNLAGFSQLIATIFAVDWKQLTKIGAALMTFPSSAGKNLAGFFKPIIDCINQLPADIQTKEVKTLFGGSEKSFQADSRIKSFMNLFNMFAMIPKKSIKRMKKLGTTLNAELANGIVEFFTSIITMVKTEFKDNKTFKGQLESFISLFKLFDNISIATVWKIDMLSKHLNKSKGQKIGNFFSGLIEKITEPGESKTKEAVNMAKSFALLITALTLSFVALVAIAALAKPAQIGIAAGILVVLVGIVIGTIWALCKVKNEDTKGALYTAGMASILFLTLTIVFASMVAIVKDNDWKTLLKAGVAVAALVTISVLTIKCLSNKETKDNAKESLYTAGVVILIMLAITAVAAISISLAKNWKNVLIGMGIVIGITLAIVGILWLISQIKKSTEDGVKGLIAITLSLFVLSISLNIFARFAKKVKEIGKENIWQACSVMTALVVTMVAVLFAATAAVKWEKKGLLGLAGITAALLGITVALNLFGTFALMVSKLSGKDLAVASAIAIGIIGVTIGIMVAAAACIAGPQAAIFAIGLAAGAAIAAAIAMISGSLLLFTEFIIKTKQISEDDIKNVATIISGNGDNSMIGCLKTIIEALSSFSLKAAIKVGIIGTTLRPVFESLSTFVDVIQQMANMQIVDHYEKDKNGNQIPIYRKMTNAEFTDAAITLSGAFTTFMNTLYNEFNSKEKLDIIKKILKTFKSGNVGDLMVAIGSFSKAIVDFASLRVPDKWNKDGIAIHYTKLTNKDFTNAAITLASAFTTFITTLQSDLEEDSKKIPALLKLFKSDDENTIIGLIDAVSHCIDPLAKLAAGKWGDDDKTKITKDTLETAVSTLIDPIMKFIKDIETNEKTINKAIKLRQSIRNISNDMVYIGNKFAELKSKNFAENAKNFYNGSKQIFLTLDLVKEEYEDKSDIYEASLKNMASGLKRLYPEIKRSWKPMTKNANALKKFDNELISKRDERNQAMTEITSNFQNMSEQVNAFNDGFRETLNLFKKYLDYKSDNERHMWKWFSKNTKETFEDVGKSISQSAEKMSEVVVNDKTNQQQQVVAGGSNAELVNAITGALSAWSTTAKNVTLELSDSGIKALGKVYLK